VGPEGVDQELQLAARAAHADSGPDKAANEQRDAEQADLHRQPLAERLLIKALQQACGRAQQQCGPEDVDLPHLPGLFQ